MIPQKFLSGDFNGDGLTDVIAISKPYQVTQCLQTLPQNGQPCGPFDEPFLKKGKENKSVQQDTIGNNTQGNSGLRIPIDDCCQCETYNVNTSRVSFIDLNRNKTSNYTNYAGYLSQAISSIDSNNDIQVADFNGDGKSDFIVISEDRMIVYSLNNSNQLIQLINVSNESDIDKDEPHLLGDYNGDGKTDVLVPTVENSSNWVFYFSKGNGFYKKTANTNFNYTKSKVGFCTLNDNCLIEVSYIPNDINNDGKTDMIMQANYTNYYSGNPIRFNIGFAEKHERNNR